MTGAEEQRRGGLGKPLDEVLFAADDPTGPLVDMLGGGFVPDEAGPLLELLAQRFPDDLVGVCFEPEPEITVIRLAGHLADPAAAWAVSGALRAVLRLQRPQVFGPPPAVVYAIPRGLDGALCVRRLGRPLSVAEQRYIELLARHVR